MILLRRLSYTIKTPNKANIRKKRKRKMTQIKCCNRKGN